MSNGNIRKGHESSLSPTRVAHERADDRSGSQGVSVREERLGQSWILSSTRVPAGSKRQAARMADAPRGERERLLEKSSESHRERGRFGVGVWSSGKGRDKGRLFAVVQVVRKRWTNVELAPWLASKATQRATAWASGKARRAV